MAQTRKPLSNLSQNEHKKELVWRKNQAFGTECHWSDVDATILRGAIDAVSKAGGALMFGVTSDGGAFSLCILQGDQKVKEYPHSPASCEETLTGMTQWYADWKL